MNENIFLLEDILIVVDYEGFNGSSKEGFKNLIKSIEIESGKITPTNNLTPYFQLIYNSRLSSNHRNILNQHDVYFSHKPKGYDDLSEFSEKYDLLKKEFIDSNTIKDHNPLSDIVVNNGEPDPIHFTTEFQWPEGGYEEFVDFMNSGDGYV